MNAIRLVCIVSLTVLSITVIDSRSNHIPTDDPSVNASRVCKPGPQIDTSSNQKKCLVIGDSVSIGYTSRVKSSLKEICDVYHAPWDTRDGGALDSKYAVKCLEVFLRTNFQEKVFYDVIVFNFGLHDSDLNNENPEEYTDDTTYMDNLKTIKSALLATGSLVGYVLTTPVPFNVTTNERVKTFNVIASDVMSRYPAVEVADLYKWIVLVCGEPPYNRCEIAATQPSPHYTSDGYSYLSVLVSDQFSSLLLSESPPMKVKHHDNDVDDVGNDITVTKAALQESPLPCKNKSGQTVTMCPGYMTCSPSTFSETGWGCCPLSHAVSCTDGKHCCPDGFECDPSCTAERCVCNQL